MNDARSRLFAHRRVYDQAGTEALFVEAVRDNVAWHARDAVYARWLSAHGFAAEDVRSVGDISRIPPLPADFFKQYAFEAGGSFLHATSSGTHGQRSQIDLDEDTYKAGLSMAFNVMRHHKLLSPVPVHYIMLCFEPRAGDDTGAVKTAMGVTRLAPALSRTFALRWNGQTYEPDGFSILDALERHARGPFPVRFVGFPAYLFFLCDSLRRAGKRLKLPRGSLALLGGGWKGFSGQEIPQEDLLATAYETLGLDPVRVRDFYSALEHPVAYAQCNRRHLHVPIHSRVIIRDAQTLEPLPHGEAGLLSFVTPLALSLPLTSVVMSDIAALHPPEECGCGIPTAWFEVLGRAGVLRNCAASAAEMGAGA